MEDNEWTEEDPLISDTRQRNKVTIKDGCSARQKMARGWTKCKKQATKSKKVVDGPPEMFGIVGQLATKTLSKVVADGSCYGS